MSDSLDRGLTADPTLLGKIADPKQVNYLDIQGSAAKAAEGIWANRESQAQQAWGNALQQATDPQTGAVDYARANALAAGNPQAAMGMMKGLTGATALTGTVQTQGIQRNQVITDAMSSILSEPDDAKLHDTVIRTTQQLVERGVLTRAQADKALLSMPNDPQQLRQTMERNRIALLPPTMQQPAIYQTPGSQTGPGGETIGTQQDVRTGAVTPAQPPGTGARLGLSPAEAAEIIQVPHPQFLEDGKTPNPNWGRTFPMTKGEMLKLLPGGAQSGGGLPPSLRNPNKAPSAAVPAPAAPATEPTKFGTGPSPADTEQQRREAEQGATGFQSISDQAVTSRSRSAILGNMLADTTLFTTGSLAARIERIRNLANRVGISVNTEGLSAQESFNKLAAQLANAQGAGSDARLNVNVAANPHQELSPAGVDLMVRQLQGNEDYLQARAKLASAYGDQKNVKKFESEIGANIDPRVFQYERMKPEQKAAYFASLQDKEAFKKAHKWGSDKGLFGG